MIEFENLSYPRTDVTFHQSRIVLFLFSHICCETHHSHHLLGRHARGIKPLLIYFLQALRCSNLIREVISLT